MNGARQIDVERVICRLDDIEPGGARGFAIGGGDWPMRGFVVRINDAVRGFINSCPHAGHPSQPQAAPISHAGFGLDPVLVARRAV